jgi:hypothetical protein
MKSASVPSLVDSFSQKPPFLAVFRDEEEETLLKFYYHSNATLVNNVQYSTIGTLYIFLHIFNIL